MLEPVLNYVTMPVLNAGLTIDKAYDDDTALTFKPIQTVMPIFPTPIRDFIWDPNAPKKYGELVSTTWNTTTFITPFVRDFGIIGSMIFLSLFFFYCIYVYHLARCGSVVSIVRLSPLMMCIGLSFLLHTSLA